MNFEPFFLMSYVCLPLSSSPGITITTLRGGGGGGPTRPPCFTPRCGFTRLHYCKPSLGNGRTIMNMHQGNDDGQCFYWNLHLTKQWKYDMPSTHDYCFTLCRETGPLTFGNPDYRERKPLCTNEQKSLRSGTHTREDCVSLWAHLSRNRSTGWC